MASHVGKETEFDALGEHWTASRWERGKCQDEFVAWARTKLPDPRETAANEVEYLVARAAKIMARQDLSQMEKQLLIDGNLRQQQHACEYSLDVQNEYLSIDSKPVAKIMSSDEGGLKMLQLMLKEHHGDVPTEKCLAILTELGTAGIQKLFNKVAGETPPKAPAPTRGTPSSDEDAASPLPGVTSTRSLSAATHI